MSRRDQIAEALTGRWLSYAHEDGSDDLVEHPDRDGARITAEHAVLLADELLPLVDRLRAEAAAEALNDAADYHKRQMGTVGAFNIPLRPGDFSPWLRRRAAAVKPSKEQQP